MTKLKYTRAPISPLRFIFLVFPVLLLLGCHSNSHPSIKFTKIPPAAQGGRERVDTISGTVTGARPGQQIVVYAHSGPWWVQPWPDQSLIPIQSDSTWTTATHLGFDYAALLVEPGFHPAPTMDFTPVVSGPVAAVQITKGTGAPQIAPTVPLRFSAYDWQVRTIAADIGGVNNLFDPENAWTDPGGALHLKIKKKDARWSCAHLTLAHSLGYGTYILTVRDTAQLDPPVVLSMATFDDWGAEQHYREMDVELGQWGDASNKNNAQFAIQPFYVPGNVAPFHTPAGPVTYFLHWESGRASFKAVRGAALHGEGAVIFEHVFTSGVPTPGQEKILLMFYVVASDQSPLQRENEVVIEKFEYLP
jgi:hypothetical protein